LPLVKEGILNFESFRRLTNMTIRESAHYLSEHNAVDAIPVDAYEKYLNHANNRNEKNGVAL